MNLNEKKKLSTGRYIPAIGLGTWELKDDTADIIDAALRMGYTMVDTSSDYGTQKDVGEGLIMSGLKREDVYVVTKVEETDDAYDRTVSNLEELKLDYVDLTLIHRPPKSGAGEDLWQDLIKAQEDGMTKDIGVSNYSEEQIMALFQSSQVMPTVNQIEWSPFGWSQRMLDFCNENNILIQAYSPVTRGERLDDSALTEIAKRYDKTPAQILIRWGLQTGVVPMPKANKISHLEENIQVFDFELTPTDMARLCSLDEDFSALSEEPIYMEQRGRKDTIRYEEEPNEFVNGYVGPVEHSSKEPHDRDRSDLFGYEDSRLDDTHPITDTDMDPQELYDEGLREDTIRFKSGNILRY